MIDIILKGLSLGLLLAILIGPVFFTLIQTSIEKGFPQAFAVALGIACSDIFYIAVSYFGLSRLFNSQWFKDYLGIAGGAILILFGLYSLLKKRNRSTQAVAVDKNGGYTKSFLKGLIVNGVSPFVVIFWIGVVSMVSVEYDFSQNQIISFFVVVITTVFITDLTKAYLAGRLRSLINTRSLKIMNTVVGIVLILFGLRLMFYVF